MTGDVRDELAAACHVLGYLGHDDYQLGHVSARASEGTFWVKPKGMDLGEVTAEQMVLVDLQGSVVEGTEERPGEYPIHAEVLRARPDVNVVVHSHAMSSIAVSCLTESLRPYSFHALPFVACPMPVFREITDLIVTGDRGRAVARTLGQANGLLLQNHGMVTVGADIAHATLYAAMLETACELHLRVGSQGKESAWTPEHELDEKFRRCFTEHSVNQMYTYLKRKAHSS